VPFACRGLSPSPLAAGRLRQFAPSARLTEIFYHNLPACQGWLGLIWRERGKERLRLLRQPTQDLRHTFHAAFPVAEIGVIAAIDHTAEQNLKVYVVPVFQAALKDQAVQAGLGLFNKLAAPAAGEQGLDGRDRPETAPG